jgi:hypothetical protein
MIKKAIIIGAGESLNDSVLEDLLSYNDEKIAIFSSDRTLKHVLDMGFTPDKYQMFTCITEDLVRPIDKFDFLTYFFDNDIVKKYSNDITLFTSHVFSRIKEIEEIGFKKRFDFIRHGKKGRSLSNIPTINNCGNNVMGLMGFARIYEIPYISTIGFDMDKTGSWKNLQNDHEYQLTKKKLFQDYLDYGYPIYNLTTKGLIHGKGVITTTLKEFMKL